MSFLSSHILLLNIVCEGLVRHKMSSCSPSPQSVPWYDHFIVTDVIKYQLLQITYIKQGKGLLVIKTAKERTIGHCEAIIKIYTSFKLVSKSQATPWLSKGMGVTMWMECIRKSWLFGCLDINNADCTSLFFSVCVCVCVCVHVTQFAHMYDREGERKIAIERNRKGSMNYIKI